MRRKERPLILKVQIAKKSEKREDDKYACVGMEDPRNGGKALYKLACRQSVHDKCREPPTHHPGPKTLTPAAPRASRILSPPTARRLCAAAMKARSVSRRPPKTACPRRLRARTRSRPRASRSMTTGMLPWLNNCFELDYLKRSTALLARSPSEEILIDRPKMIDFNDAPKMDNNSTMEASINKTGVKK